MDRVNALQSEAELVALRRSLVRGRPFGSTEDWETRTAALLALTHTLRDPGRPKKAKKAKRTDGQPPKSSAPR